MYKLNFTKDYKKKELKFLKKHKHLFSQYSKTLKFLREDPFYPSIRLHKLKGNLKEYYSVSINMSYRIVINLIIIDNEIYLLDIGSHDDVY